MDAIELLKSDHKKVKGLFREFEQAGGSAYKTRQRIAEQVFQELEIHTRIEEESFYPAVKERRVSEGMIWSPRASRSTMSWTCSSKS